MAYKKLKLWFDKDLAKLLADKVSIVDDSFPSKKFITSVDNGVSDLELKARVELIADKFHEYISEDYKETVAILIQILGPENEEETGMFTNFYWVMPIAKYVEKYGLDDFDISMKAIEEITKRNTGEYTIRPYIENHLKKSLSQLKKWSKSKNRHVRRLSSEGPRPRLPWANKLQIFIDDPSPILPILNTLKDDPSKYVQNSVANCINDILKDNLDIGKDLIERWIPAESKNTSWIIKHALRILKKEEDKWALNIISKLKAK